MVCLGNICRSPLAEGILRHKISKANLDWQIESAGTSSWHVGEAPDNRAQAIAEVHGVDITDIRSRMFTQDDFKTFDKILVMDNENYEHVAARADGDANMKKIEYLMNYSNPGQNQPVPDPYFGDDGFDKVFNMLDEALDGFIDSHK